MDLKFYYDKDLPKPTKLKQEYLRSQFNYLQTLPQNEQKSEGWYAMRLTMISASDWGTILGENHYSTPNQVLLKKCGEDSFMTNAAMQWGNKYEDVAISVYEYRNSVKIIDFGCIRHPSISFLGASPDGITTDGVMLEIKCPTSRQITGIPPRYYWCQVQGQLEVCELDRCDFLECKFKEYEGGEEEYINDNYNEDHRFCSIGHEKGVVVEFYNNESKSFFYKYSPVCIIGDDLDQWKAMIVQKHITENIILSTFDYWYLEEISCIPIYRNQEWFNEAKIKLEEFWLKILKYRKLGLNKLKEDLQEEKDNKKEEKKFKKEEKVKIKEDNKKQRKMKDYITFDDLNQENNTENNTENIIIANNAPNIISTTSKMNNYSDNDNNNDSDNDEFSSSTITSFFSN
jgi:putative phage-type endonuclease